MTSRLAAVLLLGLVTACAPTPPPATSASTSEAPVVAQSARPTSRPAPGRVVIEDGPFTDRIRVGELSLTEDAVTGRLAVTTDISDVLLLELICTFYDDHGATVGTGSFQHRHSEGDAHESGDIEFRITPESSSARVSAAVLSVPVLVNE